MTDVQRYKPLPTADGVTMHPNPQGAYVRYADYAELDKKIKAVVPQAWTNLLAYVLQEEMHNRLTPRVIDIAYTAFMQAKKPNEEDGTASDWFTDTRPVVKNLIEKLRKDLIEELPSVQPLSPEQIMQAWADTPTQGDPSGKAFALAFGARLLELQASNLVKGVEPAIAVSATVDGEPSNVELRGLWHGAGGSFHGPNVETGSMPEQKLLPFLRGLIKSSKAQHIEALTEAQAGLEVAVARTPSVGDFKTSEELALGIVSKALESEGHTPATGTAEPMPFEGGSSYEASTLRNLLAVIHRDGGHYTAKHGIIKSADDAEKIVVDLIRAAADKALGLATSDDQRLLWTYRYYGSEPMRGYALVEVGTRSEVLKLGTHVASEDLSVIVDELCHAHNSVVEGLLKRIKSDAGNPTSETASVLPDGSAFMTASFPLPEDHWLYKPRAEHPDSEYSPELPRPILTHYHRDEVMVAAQYAIRAATNCGKIKDYDPDAMVQNFVIAMCGHYGNGRPHPAKPEHAPVVRVVAPSAAPNGPQDQTRFFGDPKGGNCTEAALATLLGLKLSDIPDFPHESPYQFWEALDDYLQSIGYVRLMMGNNYVPECNYLASGPSSRGCSHMVVMYEGKLAHDPHPSREGLLQVDVVHMIVPILNPVKPASQDGTSKPSGPENQSFKSPV